MGIVQYLFCICIHLVATSAESPTITDSPPSGEIQVGTLLHCAAKASRPPRVTLWLKLDEVYREVASSISRAEYRLPMNTSEGRGKVECVADIFNGEARNITTIIVKKLPLPVVLDLGDSTINAEERRHFSCRTKRYDSELNHLELTFSTGVRISREKDAQTLNLNTRTMRRTTITAFPHTAAGITMRRPRISYQAIEGTLKVTPLYNGCTVTCTGRSVPNKGKEGKQKTTIHVRWPPSVRNVIVYGDGGFDSPVYANKPAFIRCQLQEGDPNRERTASVTLTVGERIIGAPKRISNLGMDQHGYKWKEALWGHQFRLEDSGKTVKCGFDDEKPKETTVMVSVHIEYPNVIISPARNGFPGQSINCSGYGNPPPTVTITGFNKIESGLSAATLKVPTWAKGRYEVTCTAVNSVGKKSKVAAIDVQKIRIPINFTVSQSSNEINSTVILRCVPRTSRIEVSSVNLTFASGQEVYWKKKGESKNDLGEKKTPQTVIVRAAPFMHGKVQCRLESADHSCFGIEEKQIELKWEPKLRRLFTIKETRRDREFMKEGDLLNLTCELEVGSPPTKKQVEFLGRDATGQRTIGKDFHTNGWTLRNVSTQVRLTWRHDEELLGCSLGEKKLTKRLKVEHEPTILVIGPSLVVTPGQAVRCTAVGSPTPSVRLRLRQPQSGWEEKSGFGEAELTAGRHVDEKSYTVECDAMNRHGEDRQSAMVVVKAKKTNYYGGFVTAMIFCVLLLLAVITMILLLFYIRRPRVSTANISERNHHQAYSNTYSNVTSNNYVGMDSTQQEQADPRQTNSRIVCTGVYEEILYSPSQSLTGIQTFKQKACRPLRNFTRTRPDHSIIGLGQDGTGVYI